MEIKINANLFTKTINYYIISQHLCLCPNWDFYRSGEHAYEIQMFLTHVHPMKVQNKTETLRDIYTNKTFFY